MSNFAPETELAEHAARAAADILLEYYGHVEVREKSTQNLVTQADLESERLIAQLIHERFPHHQLMQEETVFTGDVAAEHLWIVDPLDGTNNFAHGIPQFCISIAYAERGVVQAGVVYDPLRQELFAARRGFGATRNGQPLHVSQPTGLERSIISTGFYYERDQTMENTLAAIGRLFRANVRGIRRMGAAALDLSWVACGRFQGFFEYKLAPWDYAAGALLVSEAGGICYDRTGAPLNLSSGSVLACCPAIADRFVALTRWE